jgi:hypothetical protein
LSEGVEEFKACPQADRRNVLKPAGGRNVECKAQTAKSKVKEQRILTSCVNHQSSIENHQWTSNQQQITK